MYMYVCTDIYLYICIHKNMYMYIQIFIYIHSSACIGMTTVDQLTTIPELWAMKWLRGQ
jgi:hypothetical protein